MPMRRGSRRARAAAARAQGRVRAYRRRMLCACGATFQYQPPAQAPSQCPTCASALAERFTVFDRDRGIGQLPSNLRKYADA